MTETYIEKRKRGFFGWLFLLIFLGWNLLMFLWVWGVSQAISDKSITDPSQSAGVAIGTGLAMGFIIFIWVSGAVITGLLALLTRGSKTVITQRGPREPPRMRR